MHRSIRVLVGLPLVVGAAAYASATVASQLGHEPYRKLLAPLVYRYVDPETAHRAAIWAAKHGLLSRGAPSLDAGTRTPARRRAPGDADAVLRTRVWRREFASPVGLAAGFDKDGEAVDGMLGAGFDHVELGTVTPRAQPGNARPRVFRLVDDRAVINRYGFNSQGADAVAARLHERRECAPVPASDGSAPSSSASSSSVTPLPASWSAFRDRFRQLFRAPWHPGIVGVNLGKNRATSETDAADDYVACVRRLGAYADYLVVNVSSPNTPGLRNLQGRDALYALLKRVIDARDAMHAEAEAERCSTAGANESAPPHSAYSPSPRSRTPVLVKVSPDLTDTDMQDIADVVRALRIDGIIVSNTTIQRPTILREPDAALRAEAGGLSGPPLRAMSTRVLRRMYRLTHGRVPLIGVGGVSSGADAYEKVRAGASLVQVYTAMVYDGVGVAQRVKEELAECLARDGFGNVQEAVGADNR